MTLLNFFFTILLTIWNSNSEVSHHFNLQHLKKANYLIQFIVHLIRSQLLSKINKNALFSCSKHLIGKSSNQIIEFIGFLLDSDSIIFMQTILTMKFRFYRILSKKTQRTMNAKHNTKSQDRTF